MRKEYVITIMLLTVLAAYSAPADASCPCTTTDTDTINGSIYYKSSNSWPGDGEVGHRYKTCTFTDVPAGVKIAKVHAGVWMLGSGNVEITVNGASSGAVTASGCPNCNAINTPKMHDYCTGSGAGFITYNATADIPPGGGDVPVKVESTSADDGRIYVIALLVVCENASMPSMTYCINECARFSPTTTGFAGPYSEADVTDVTYWTLGVPHGIDDGNGNAFLNSNDIGHWDHHEGGSYYDFYRWDDISPDYLNEPNDQMFHPVASEYDRLSAAVFMLERGGDGDTTPSASVTNLANSTGNFQINWTWDNPADPDFNHTTIYIDNGWVLNTSGNFYNDSYSPHATKTISTHDETENVNRTWVNQTTTIPNNPPVLDSIGNKAVNETETLAIDADATDSDSDTLTYSCNRTDLFTDFDFATGYGNWTPGCGDADIYYVDFGASDGYGGIDNETVRITVTDESQGDICGDVNNDGVVNWTDVITLWYDYADHPYPGAYTITNEWAADVNCDGVINMADVMTLWYDVKDYPNAGDYEVNCCG
ncbi:MAG: hypothetical protein C4B59_00900 [Candidatus Methanogaster sp.]|uniref:Uncharacterized protein n=1 Tax=Candidatus Methanogaster sp. TaxID=3386292 RepID=A0AC61L796_9EURY|nr:MAG: hypothetical protein C4B59_00900 [ANME-2 cluster archaeon]